MPQILVTAGPTDQHGGGTVMLRERVNAADFESERFAANLVERLGWAVRDATEAEQDHPSPPEVELQSSAESEPVPYWEPMVTA
jgi:hypothetical protein